MRMPMANLLYAHAEPDYASQTLFVIILKLIRINVSLDNDCNRL